MALYATSSPKPSHTPYASLPTLRRTKGTTRMPDASASPNCR